MATTDTFRVKLMNSTQRDEYVTFDVTPDLIENRNINYKSNELTHMPGGIFVFSNSSSRTYNISNIRLISRTTREASINLWRLNTLRSWTVPSFGESSTIGAGEHSTREEGQNPNQYISEADRQRYYQIQNQPQRETRGHPPSVLLLSAYSHSNSKIPGHIRNVPVIIQQISIPYPSDVDYIYTDHEKPVPMPTIMTLDMTLVETHSPREYQKFSLQAFKKGVMPGF